MDVECWCRRSALFSTSLLLDFVANSSEIINILSVPFYAGGRGGTVIKVLYYKSEGRWFDPSWCHWNFSLI